MTFRSSHIGIKKSRLKTAGIFIHLSLFLLSELKLMFTSPF